MDKWVASYSEWLVRHARTVAAVAAILAAAGSGLAITLPLRTEFTFLLPDQQPSVLAFHRLSERKPSSAVVEVGISSPSPEANERFSRDLANRLRATVPADLLFEVDEGKRDAQLRAFLWSHRQLYAPLPELERAVTALQRETKRRNPFLIDLEDTPDAGVGEIWTELREHLDHARSSLVRPIGYLSDEGRLRMLVVRCRFGDTEPLKGQRLLKLLQQAIAAQEPSRYHPEMDVGYAGALVTASMEQGLLLRDMARSTLLCFSLVMVVIWISFRSTRAVFALCCSLLAGCALTFGVTRLWIGHLNTSTAFLASVVAGNGINFGIIFLWRYREEARHSSHEVALRVALRRTAAPTLIAALAAGTAYLSLASTTFRGFNEFGKIAGSGMVLCWIASYTLLPALLTLLSRGKPLFGAVAVRRENPVEPLARSRSFLGLSVVVALLALCVHGAGALRDHPFEDDLRTLRSRSIPGSPLGRWATRIVAAFGRARSGGFYFGVDHPEDAAIVARAIEETQAGLAPQARRLSQVVALSTALPGDREEQTHRIRILEELRGLAERVLPTLPSDGDKARLLSEWMPASGALHLLGPDDLPAEVRDAFREQDGRLGLIVSVYPGPAYDKWRYAELVRTVSLLRSLALPEPLKRSVVLSGHDALFVDMMTAVGRDGPRASLLSLGLVLFLLVGFFGLRRTAAHTFACLLLGCGGMIGLLFLLGDRLNFINYAAIPITIGIGVDYPFNVLARLKEDGALHQIRGAVALCSATTIIGYTALLPSDNGAIRSFGLAAALGELTCLATALFVAPLLAGRRHPRD